MKHFINIFQNQILNNRDWAIRREHCEAMLAQYAIDPNMLDKVFYLDETTIDLNWCPGTHTVVIIHTYPD